MLGGHGANVRGPCRPRRLRRGEDGQAGADQQCQRDGAALRSVPSRRGEKMCMHGDRLRGICHDTVAVGDVVPTPTTSVPLPPISDSPRIVGGSPCSRSICPMVRRSVLGGFAFAKTGQYCESRGASPVVKT